MLSKHNDVKLLQAPKLVIDKLSKSCYNLNWFGGKCMTVEYKASEQFYNVAKSEYDYELNRNATLDNKVSTTLAFCGVVLLFMIDYLNIRSLWNINLPHQCWECILRFMCSLLQISCVSSFAVCIIKLFGILTPRTYCRLDPNYLLNETLPEWEERKAYMYLGVKYSEIAAFNRHVNEDRIKKYGKAIKWLLFAILFCILSEIIKNNFLCLEVLVNE